MRTKAIATILTCAVYLSGQVSVGEEAPKAYLQQLGGGSFYLSRVVGEKVKPEDRKPVVISFFQTTCIPCKAEIAELEKLQDEFPLVKIYLVDLNEDPSLVTEYVEKFNLKLDMLIDRYGVVGKKFGAVDENGVAKLPNTYVIDTDGLIYYHHTGFKPGDEAAYREKFTELSKRQEEILAALAEQQAAEQEQPVEKAAAHGSNGPEVGQPAPTFFLPQLNGESFFLSKTVGAKVKPENRKPVVVSFFQTTCIPCKIEIAELEKLQEEFPGVVIYLVDLNETDELVNDYIARFDLKLKMLMDRYGSVGKKYGVVDANGLAILPNSFVIAPDGTLYYHHTGFKPGDEELYREKFKELTAD